MFSPSAPLLEFDDQGDITLIQSSKLICLDEPIPTNNCRCLLSRYILHQMSLIIFIVIYLICGGLFFSYVESQYYLKKDVERKELISETYANIRQFAVRLLNEQLNENFEDAYQLWRWQNANQQHFIYLSDERVKLLDNRTDYELETLSVRLAIIQVAVDKYVYKWTYSTAILYAVTLVTTIGFGNIAPKTAVGKISTVIYALMGILLVVSWLKLAGDSLAVVVTRYYMRVRRFYLRHIKGKKRSFRRTIDQRSKVPFWLSITLLIFYLLGGSLLFAWWEGWSYIDGAYFSFITFTTIGFGDLVPGEKTISQRNGRSLLCSVYLLFGVLLTTMSFRLIQEDIERIRGRFSQRLGIEHVYLPTTKR